MNWEAFGAISEGLGAVAVFVTLGYLAVLVRHARAELARSTQQARGDAMRQVRLAQAGQPEPAAPFAKSFAPHGVQLGAFADTAAAAGLFGHGGASDLRERVDFMDPLRADDRVAR
jgi:hypothetical protein